MVYAAGKEMPPVSSCPSASLFSVASLRGLSMLAMAVAGLIAPFASGAGAAGEGDALRFALTRGPRPLESPARPNQHVEALGEQAGVWGSLAQSFEAWVYPFKLFDGWSLFTGGEGEPVRELQSLATRHVATPHFSQLEYAGTDWRLTTTWFVPRALPGALLLLDYEGSRDLALVLRFRPSLAPMHLTAGGPLVASWEEARHELVVSESSRHLELRVNCPFATAHREIGADGEQEIQFTLPQRISRRGHVPIGISLGFPAQPDGRGAMNRLLTGAEALLGEALDHYVKQIARAPRVATPDPAVNAALLWSVVSLDQLRIHHPDLGYGLVSGYSSSGRSTRPRYCWFFEEPTLTSCAYHWLGLSDQVREALRFLQRFQRADGKTVHEIVQSLPYWPNYFQEFLYAYLHSDGPVYYLFAYGDYYRATGDLEFVRAEWSRIRRTLDWCFSAMDPADGLMRIEPGDWGSSESSRAVWKDTQLQGMWIRALRDLERLARVVGESALAERCRQVARQAAAALEAQMWDEEAGTYLWGLDRQGRPLKSLVPHHAVSFWLGALPEEHVERSLERMAAADFRTDWGVRSLALSDPKYDPQNYQAGSVWPVWNAGVIISDYRHNRSVEAYRTWQAMVRARTLDGLGPMPEVLDGRCFQRLAEGVPHQMFSELAVVNGFFDGLLGLQVDVPARQLELAPRLPPTWNMLQVDRIPCGPGSLNLRIQRSRGEYMLTIELDWPGGAQVRLAPELPAGSRLQSASLDGKTVACDREELPAATRLRLDLKGFSGRHTLRLHHSGGVDWLPVDEPLTPGATSRNLRVVRARWEDPSWHLRLEGLPGRNYPVDFFTDRSVGAATADGQVEKRKIGWRVVFSAPPNAATNAAGFAGWDAEVRFR
jgi:hypothetical protein